MSSVELAPGTNARKPIMNGLFDSPWHILILAIVVIILFGSAKLPHFARSLGKSARILKTEVQGLHSDDPETGTVAASATQQSAPAAPAQLQAATPQPDTQAQIAALQEQLKNLQDSVAAKGEPQAK